MRHEIIKYSKSIDDLKAQMQHMQEQHGKQIRNLQGIHNQELEAKDKEISRLNTILEKAFNCFPLLKEMLRMERLCYAIGFTKDMVNSLLNKREAIKCNEKIYSEEHSLSILNISLSNGKQLNAFSRMVFSRDISLSLASRSNGKN